ncbi:FHA domain-containing protein [Stratiformator vulcanicus]|uniref:FHA domain protein n=1 Tax=Stratiformator vulcanicus TaxID=2527980 RepID=A0A517R380_9PLAN|nr:FHA domain-containing protein [Stratiformator vulcanicus]QDT38321.1 FHA domain protein [Stratiformator vulcanicus]
MIQAFLKVLGGKHEGKLVPLPQGKFLVGREKDCHLRPSSELISRHHCVFQLDEYAVRLRDLGSTNGTGVNGSRLHGETVLDNGDRVVIGPLNFEIVTQEAPADHKPLTTPPAPPADSGVFADPGSKTSTDTVYELPSTANSKPASEAPAVKLPPPESTGVKEE